MKNIRQIIQSIEYKTNIVSYLLITIGVLLASVFFSSFTL